MPAVKPGESRSAYVGRCVRYVMDHDGLDQKAAVGKCEGMFDSAHKSAQRRCLKDAMGLMDPDAEASLETIFNEEPGTGYLESNISPPGSLVSVERDKPKGSISVGGFDSPAPGNATEHEKDILAHAYAAARKAGYDKERASKIAWAAVDRFRSGGKKSAAAHVRLSIAIKSMLTSQSVAVDANELYIGTCEEMEHTDDWKTAMKIALDHLREDPNYYAKLKQAGLLGYDTKAPHEFTLRKSDRTKALPFGIVYRDFHEYIRTARKAKGNRWKNPDGSFKNGFDGCVDYAKASIASGGRGLPEERAKALCAYIGRRAGKL